MKRGDLGKRRNPDGTVTYGIISNLFEGGWVVSLLRPISMGLTGSPADEGWELDEESK